MTVLDCLIVGAGIHGLCTAFWLRERGVARVAVAERHGPGHEFGSSHGSTRITRSSYDDPEFVALAATAHREGWPAIERRLGRSLRLPTPGVFFGPAHGTWDGYRRAAVASGGAVAPIPLAEARRRFPLLAFADDDGVLVDDSAAVLLAAATMQGLRQWLAAAGVDLLWHTAVLALRADPAGVAAETTAGPLVCRHAVLACGPWTGRLHADDAPPTTVLRQQVGWFDVDAPASACEPGTFPVWARLGASAEEFTYGLPSVDDSGLKAAVHRTTGAADDPDAPAPPIDADALLAMARHRFACRVDRLRRAETCLYTMAPGHRLHVRRSTGLPLTTIAACSGHAFKFAPVLGRIAADLSR
jgi:sarcosine oxidase